MKVNKINNSERVMRLFGSTLVVLLCLLSAAVTQAAVIASVDRGSLSMGDSFTFTLTATAGEDLNRTNFSALIRDFEVRSSSRESSFSYSGGKQQASNKLRIVLAPKRTGRLVIPALSVGGSNTTAITVMVREGRADLNALDEIFVEAEVSSTTVYVQSQLLYTFRLYRSIGLRDADYTWAPMDNASKEQLEGSTYMKRIDGVDYQVSELRFAIFPQESGTLEIPPLEFVGQLGRGMFERGPTLRRQSDAIKVKVLPIPDAYPGAAWIPTTQLTLTEDWSVDPATLGIGDSSTRTITLRAGGLPGSQLPPVNAPELPGVKVYPDMAKSEDITGSKGIDALGINSAAWVVIRDGEYVIPEVRIPWWDVKARKVRYATLPSRTISVAASAEPQSTAPTPVATEPSSSMTAAAAHHNYWRTAAMIILCCWLATTLWLLRRRAAPVEQAEVSAKADTESKIFKQLVASCKQGNANQSRQLLQDWLRMVYPEVANPGLDWLQKNATDNALADSLAELESSLYAVKTDTWSGKALATALKQWRKQQRARRANAKTPELPPLYPV
ncbi:BatD family protein [Candidatus Litorirhabdus singularis]|nr:BatD family protein [Candidatus Litorirhabdus singularis]